MSNSNDLDEALLAKVAGHAAKLAVSHRHIGLHQFGDAAQAGAEYAVHRGEELLKKKARQIAKGARKVAKRMTSSNSQPVTEMKALGPNTQSNDNSEGAWTGDSHQKPSKPKEPKFDALKWRKQNLRKEDMTDAQEIALALLEVSKDRLVAYQSKAAGNPKREKGVEMAANKYWNSKKVKVGSEGKNHIHEEEENLDEMQKGIRKLPPRSIQKKKRWAGRLGRKGSAIARKPE